MIGTAYLTNETPHIRIAPFETTDAVYAVYPPAIYPLGVTTHVLVSGSDKAGDIGVYPCDEQGELQSWHLLGWAVGVDHRAALRAAGYELEEVTPRAVA